MDLTVLGPLRVSGLPEPRLRDRVVLEVLVLRVGAVASVDELADALWGERPPPSARKIVQGCVLRWRRTLGDTAIITEAAGYRLSDEVVTADVVAFEAAAAIARSAVLDGDAKRITQVAGDALRLWAGEPFEDLADWLPAQPVIQGIRGLRDELIAALGEALLALGRAGDAKEVVEPAAAARPYDEALWSLLARVRYAEGRPSDALDTIRTLKSRLRDDLGISAGREIDELEPAMLERDEALSAHAMAPVQSPWPGLLPYETADADRFFGREDQLRAADGMLASSGRLVIVGRSGCGKSSFVRAALVPRLESKGLQVSLLTPGGDPLTALRHVQDDACVIVDQMEEVLTQCTDDDVRAAFFDELAGRAGMTVAVVRADLFEAVAEFEAFSALLGGGALVLRPLGADALRASIEQAARVAGLLLEPGLVDLVLRDAHEDPAALPMISHALSETCRSAEGILLTTAAYRAVGGMQGAIARTAEDVYSRLDDRARVGVRALTARLVSTQQGVTVRLRAERASVDVELCEQLLAARLLSIADDGRIQLAHESLVRHWPRLASWIAEDEEGRRVLQHLAAEARDWEQADRPPDQLYRGPRLHAAVAWSDQHPGGLTDAEEQFLRAARIAERQERRRARAGRRRAVVGAAGALVLVITTVTAGLVAYDRQQQVARAEQRTFAERLSSTATSVQIPTVALALVAEALAEQDTAVTRANALEVFGRFVDLLPTRSDVPRPVLSGQSSASSADGRLLARADDHSVVVTRRGTDALVSRFPNLSTVPTALAFDTSGRLLAASLNETGFAEAGTTVVWDVPAEVEIARFDSGDGPVTANVFASDGSSVSAVEPDGAYRWDLTASNALITSSTGEPSAFRSPDGLLTLTDRSVDRWIARACLLAGRPLTRDEWRRYLGQRPYAPQCRG